MQRTTIDELLATARRRYRRYEPAEDATALREGAVLIDLRCQEDRETEGRVDGAIPIPLTVLEWRADPDSPWRDDRIAHLDLPVIPMCNDRYSSSLSAAAPAECSAGSGTPSVCLGRSARPPPAGNRTR